MSTAVADVLKAALALSPEQQREVINVVAIGHAKRSDRFWKKRAK